MARRTELPEGSLASRVLDAGDEPRRVREQSRKMMKSSRQLASDSPAGLVLELSQRDKRVGLWAGFGVAAILHAGLFVLAWNQFGAEGEAADADPDKPPIEISHVVELDPPEPPAPRPEPPAPEPEPEPQPSPEPAAEPEPSAPEPAEPAPREPEPSPAPEQAPPAPAEAGKVVTAAPQAGEVADFTDFDITTGQGESYAGGVTASDGTNKNAAHSDTVDRDGPPKQVRAKKPAKSRARAPRPKNTDWDCPWPRKADDLSIDEQTVTLRAVVLTDGTLESLEVVSDPGFGFGKTALECARSEEWLPALDDQGNPYPLTLPRFNVRFER